MKVKVCFKCKETKSIEFFTKNSAKKDGLSLKCKSCQKAYYKVNKSRKSEYDKLYYKKNREHINGRSKQYYQDNKERIRKSNRQYNVKNKEYHKKYHKKWEERNKDYGKRYYKLNRDKKIKYLSNWIKQRKANDPLYKIICNQRSMTSYYFKKNGYSKKSKTRDIIGVDWEICKKHIENQFTEGMNWDNYGYYGWHIDHIIPLVSAKTEEELMKLCHYTNLQPLWAKDNMSKGSKLPDEYE